MEEPEKRPLTLRQGAALWIAGLFVLGGVAGLADGNATGAIACACLALVTAILGRIP